MKSLAYFNAVFLVARFAICTICSAQGNKPKPVDLGTRPPIIAMWHGAGGWKYHPPRLMFAIWNDGRFLTASDPDAGTVGFKEGHISSGQLTDLKQRVTATGVFALRYPAIRIPDATYDSLLVNFGEKEQMLEFTLLIIKGPGAMDKDTDVSKLVKCWTTINQIVISIQPMNVKPIGGTFESVPNSWYVKINH